MVRIPSSTSAGACNHLLDYPIRILAGDRNEGSHAHFPYPGEWDNVAGMGGPESVKAVGRDSSRWIAHDRFDIVLLPEPTHLDFRSRPELLREWSWFLLPVRFGFPAVPSLGSEAAVDVGNRSPFGPSYHVAWNRNAPGHAYPDYRPRRIGTVRAMVEDLLQPWYYPYIFRRPRYADDTPRAVRAELASAGIAPDTDAREKGIGSTLLGASIADPAAALGEQYGRSTGISLVRNLWVKARRGMIEASAGYQRFPRTSGAGGALYVYPITASVAARMPEALFRPYATLGGGVYGWGVTCADERQPAAHVVRLERRLDSIRGSRVLPALTGRTGCGAAVPRQPRPRFPGPARRRTGTAPLLASLYRALPAILTRRLPCAR